MDNKSERYALNLWDSDGQIFIYDLGEHSQFETAAKMAQDIMHKNHSVFVEQNNPNWQVYTCTGVTTVELEEDN